MINFGQKYFALKMVRKSVRNLDKNISLRKNGERKKSEKFGQKKIASKKW